MVILMVIQLQQLLALAPFLLFVRFPRLPAQLAPVQIRFAFY